MPDPQYILLFLQI